MHKNVTGTEELQRRLGYTWRDPALLHGALVHSSYACENKPAVRGSNERLEFLGDAVLQLTVSDYYYRLFPDKSEGELSKMRALTVCEPSLARVARQLSLGDFILLSNGEEKSGGRNRASLLADALEAVLGSIYLDAGFDEARRVALRLLAGVMSDVARGQALRDYKSELQELVQRNSTETVSYRIIDETGPDHDKVFTAVAVHRDRVLGKGRGKSKKEAEQQAAMMALEKNAAENGAGGGKHGVF